jgi:hypothetical protein
MAAYLSTELGGSANQTAAPVGYKPTATVYQARLKRMRSTFTMASQATTDTLVLGDLPAGATFAYGIITASATVGATATLAIGTSGTPAKYRAAAVHTAVDTPTFFGLAAQAAAAPLTATERVIGTIASAAFPAAGTLVIDIYYSLPN